MIFKTKWNISKLTLYNIFKFQETFYAYLIYILYSTSFAFFPHKKIIPHRTQSIRRIFFSQWCGSGSALLDTSWIWIHMEADADGVQPMRIHITDVLYYTYIFVLCLT